MFMKGAGTNDYFAFNFATYKSLPPALVMLAAE